jgi:hypothetical protein
MGETPKTALAHLFPKPNSELKMHKASSIDISPISLIIFYPQCPMPHDLQLKKELDCLETSIRPIYC